MGKLKDSRAQLITYHYSRVADQGSASQTVALHGLGILDERFLVAHGGNPSQEDADIYKHLGMHVSSTPSTELQMAMGSPVAAFRDDLGDDMPKCCSLGIDCHTNNSAFIPGEARIGLQSARASRGDVSISISQPNMLTSATMLIIYSEIHQREQIAQFCTLHGRRSIQPCHDPGCSCR